VPMLLYEAGEALRFDEGVIRAGARGVRSVMRALGMLPPVKLERAHKPYIARSSHWVRAPEAGVLRSRVRLGAHVDKGQRLGIVADPLGAEEQPVLAKQAGLVIGRTELPLVNEGDALFHVATFERPARVADSVERFHEELDGDVLY
jgi:predicted deacylase